MSSKSRPTLNLLSNPQVIQWCYRPLTLGSLHSDNKEKDLSGSKEKEGLWGNSVLGTEGGKQWTTVLCQELVREALIRLGRKNVRNTRKIKSTAREKKYNPDLECDDFVYEVKGRGWCTPGTAGEKILGAPIKYGEIPKLYAKPLKIVVVGYQEYEAREDFACGDLLDSSRQTPELNNALTYFKQNGIEYVAFTDILKQIGINSDHWGNNTSL